jgi:hypothetical protein
MARTKQTAVTSAGRQKVAKKSARNTKAPVKKTLTSKLKGYVSKLRAGDFADRLRAMSLKLTPDTADLQKQSSRTLLRVLRAHSTAPAPWL